MLPKQIDFLIAGTQKGGTTALDKYLREHPKLCISKRKEVHFFDRDQHFPDGVEPDYGFYHGFFEPRASDTLAGETTPVYMYWRDAPQRIRRYNPDMKLIFVLRDPMSRAFSHWNMQRQKMREFLPFSVAIRTEAKRCRESLPHHHKAYSYVDRGLYFQQLNRVWAHFPKSQTLVLRSEELKGAPKKVLDEICAFLGVDTLDTVQAGDVNSRHYSSSMAKSDWLYLRSIFEPDIRALESALGWDCTEWLSDPGAGS